MPNKVQRGEAIKFPIFPKFKKDQILFVRFLFLKAPLSTLPCVQVGGWVGGMIVLIKLILFNFSQVKSFSSFFSWVGGWVGGRGGVGWLKKSDIKLTSAKV